LKKYNLIGLFLFSFQLIIEYLKNGNIGVTKTQLSADLRTNINTMTKYLQFLEEFENFVKKKLSNKALYFMNEEILEKS